MMKHFDGVTLPCSTHAANSVCALVNGPWRRFVCTYDPLFGLSGLKKISGSSSVLFPYITTVLPDQYFFFLKTIIMPFTHNPKIPSLINEMGP